MLTFAHFAMIAGGITGSGGTSLALTTFIVVGTGDFTFASAGSDWITSSANMNATRYLIKMFL
jgi:hypothetical protein